MRQLGKRLLSSFVILSITLTMIFVAPQGLFFCFIVIFSLLGFSEFLDLAKAKGLEVHKFLGLLFGACLPMAMVYHAESWVLMLAVLAMFSVCFRPPLQPGALAGIAVTIFGMIYVMWFCAYIIFMRDLEQGPWWVFYTVLLVKGGDSAAYFAGKKFGKVRLIEHISPKKSVEGSIACLVASVVLSLISKTYLPEVEWGHLVILGLIVGFVSQLGDLGESLFKRDAGIKDSGQVPGLGGILDVLDSLTLTIPFVFYYVTVVLGYAA